MSLSVSDETMPFQMMSSHLPDRYLLSGHRALRFGHYISNGILNKRRRRIRPVAAFLPSTSYRLCVPFDAFNVHHCHAALPGIARYNLNVDTFHRLSGRCFRAFACSGITYKRSSKCSTISRPASISACSWGFASCTASFPRNRRLCRMSG